MDQNLKISKLVANPSLGAVTYEACHLVEEIKSLDLRERPIEFAQIRNLLLCLTEQILNRLWALYPEDDPLGAKGPEGFHHTRSLAEALRAVYSYMRYICRDSFRQRPRSLHFLITRLAYHYFPQENGKPICIVRAQWHYNNKCVTLSDEIREILTLFAFDDANETDPDELITRWWKDWLSSLSQEQREQFAPNDDPPLQVGVLSFGGLDDQDVFLYPLLAHEIGHFIDSSYSQPLHLNVPVEEGDWPDEDQLRDYFQRAGHVLQDDQVDRIFDELSELTYIGVRELLADLVGVRIMGFAYFISLAEYLKTIYAWTQWPIDEETGYPGITLRLWLILKHLNSSDYGLDLKTFLHSGMDAEPAISQFLLKYFAEWEVFLDAYHNSLMSIEVEPHYDALNSNDTPTTQLAIRALLAAAQSIEAAAKQAVPNHIKMTRRLFDRVHELEHGHAPYFADDNELAFAELMAAAWTYEFMSGEEQEIENRTISGQYRYYTQTCNNILSAMQSVFVNNSSTSAET